MVDNHSHSLTNPSTKSSETDSSLKTRHFADIITELTRSMQIHQEMGTILGGVHLELTGEVNDDGFSVVSGDDVEACSLYEQTLTNDVQHGTDGVYRRIDGIGG